MTRPEITLSWSTPDPRRHFFSNFFWTSTSRNHLPFLCSISSMCHSQNTEGRSPLSSRSAGILNKFFPHQLLALHHWYMSSKQPKLSSLTDPQNQINPADTLEFQPPELWEKIFFVLFWFCLSHPVCVVKANPRKITQALNECFGQAMFFMLEKRLLWAWVFLKNKLK